VRARQRQVRRVAGAGRMHAPCVGRCARAAPSPRPRPPPRCRQAGKYFKVKERKSCLTTELRAGTVTFLTARPPDPSGSWSAVRPQPLRPRSGLLLCPPERGACARRWHTSSPSTRPSSRRPEGRAQQQTARCGRRALGGGPRPRTASAGRAHQNCPVGRRRGPTSPMTACGRTSTASRTRATMRAWWRPLGARHLRRPGSCLRPRRPLAPPAREPGLLVAGGLGARPRAASGRGRRACGAAW
jgi:hypothetical protein